MKYDPCNDMDEPLKHYAYRKKPDKNKQTNKHHILHDSIYIKCPE